jgi:bifunctional UDP-N-acetylglucosamine pyrophosphorylase/glucosamine-1-phosphate N-acetyltransferase
VYVAEGAYIGAASCITEDVPADALAVARGPQVNKAGWAKQRREKLKRKAEKDKPGK